MKTEKNKGWQPSWKTAAYTGGVFGLMFLIFLLRQPPSAEYCQINPTDAESCLCTKWMDEHVRFWNEFNTTPDWLMLARNQSLWKETFPEDTKIIEDRGNLVIMSNLSGDYWIHFYYEEVPRKCVEAVKKPTGKPKYEKIEVKPSYNLSEDEGGGSA